MTPYVMDEALFYSENRTVATAYDSMYPPKRLVMALASFKLLAEA